MSKKKRRAFVKIEAIQPKNVIDIWRMYEAEDKENKQAYPDYTEETSQDIRHDLLAYLLDPNFMGASLRLGKRPIGHILGTVVERKIGYPRRAYFISRLWIDPKFRGQGHFKYLTKEFTKILKDKGVYHWESHLSDDNCKRALNLKERKVKKYFNMVGGKIET